MNRLKSLVETSAVEPTVPDWTAVNTARVLSKIFVVAVISLLVGNLIQTAYPLLPQLVQPVDEYRSPTRLPAPELLLDQRGGFAAALNDWFDDKAGFRDLLIRTKNQIDYSLFGTSRKVYVGSDGWLFERSITDEGLIFDGLTPTEFRAYEQAFKAVSDQLQHRGARLVVVGYPDKATLYPEYLPVHVRAIDRGRNYQLLRGFLAHQKEIIFIDALDVLRREKSATGEHLYYETDLHANMAGTIAVVKEIVQRIAEAEGRSDIRWHENLDMAVVRWYQGDTARFLSLLEPVSEMIPYARAGYDVGRPEPDGNWDIRERRPANQLAVGEIPPFMFEFRSTPDLCRNRLPGMLLYGNSFADNYWNVGLHRYFCFVRRAYQMTNRLPAVIGALPPGTKYVIYQYFDAYLPDSAPIPE
jgi:alginate O-acetyltransferase complex protein AlgJ